MMYTINGIEYELYVAASGDYCVTVGKYGEEPVSYNLGSRESALAFILSNYEVKEDE